MKHLSLRAKSFYSQRILPYMLYNIPFSIGVSSRIVDETSSTTWEPDDKGQGVILDFIYDNRRVLAWSVLTGLGISVLSVLLDFWRGSPPW